MSENNATSNTSIQTSAGLPQHTPEFAAYVERSLHEEIERRERVFEAERQRREAQFAQELQQREQAFLVRLQQFEETARRREQELVQQNQILSAQVLTGNASSIERDGDIIMQPASSAPSAQPNQSVDGTAIVPVRKPITAGTPKQNQGDGKARGSGPSSKQNSSKPKPRRQTRKSRIRANQTTRSELPKDIGGLQRALYAHLRILWRLPRHAVPKAPSAEARKTFSARFSTKEALQSVAADTPAVLPPSQVDTARELVLARGEVPYTLSLETPLLDYIHAFTARYGLHTWSPDLEEDAYSLYNTAHRIIAVATFKQALISGDYDYFGPSRRYVTATFLITRLYDHFVHYFQFLRFRREMRRPGSAITAGELAQRYKRRKRLAKAQAKFARKMKLPKRYIRIVRNAKATSDDEWDPSTCAFTIRRRPEHSQTANHFFRTFDKLWEKTVKLEGRWRRQPRVVPREQKDTEFPQLPFDMPLDYFDAEFYNSLLPSFRRKISNHTIVFPLDSATILQAPHFLVEKLTQGQLMAQCGPNIMRAYDIPGSEVEDEDDSADLAEGEDEEMLDDESELEEEGDLVDDRNDFVDFMDRQL